jgi:hypothetical protein
MHDTGKVLLGLAVFAGVVTGPVWYGLGRGRGAPPELQKPAEGTRCIEPTPIMRAQHMEILNRWRDAVVRRGETVYVAGDGQRYRISLTGTCLRCHVEPAKFCIKCHEYAGVQAFCWDCHQEKRRVVTAARGGMGGQP